MCPANAAGRGCISRQRQFAPCVLGVLMRASLPRCSQSASGMMAVSETLARQAQIMPSVRVSGAQWKGIGQAKAVVFFLIVVVISLIQLHFTRSKEVQQ